MLGFTLFLVVACGPDASVGDSARPEPTGPGGRLYWSDKDAGAIGWYDPGLGVAETVLTGLPNPRGVVVDERGITWIDADLGTLQRASHDGTGVTSLTGGLTQPADLAPVAEGWVVANRGAGELVSMSDSGERSVLGGVGTEPYFVTVADGQVWFGEFDSSTIYRVPVEGGPTTPALTGLERVRAVVVAEGWLLWCDRGSGKVQRAPVDAPVEIDDLYIDQGTPHGLWVQGSDLYWTDTQSGTIRHGSLDGAAPYEVVVDGLRGPWDLAWYGP